MTESTACESGDGGGKEVAELRIDGGVDIGLGGGEACNRRLVRRDAKKAVRRHSRVNHGDLDWKHFTCLRCSTAISPTG